jgi:hypothetical protein
MTGFASMEPIQHTNSKTFASGIMKVQLRYGFCQTVILDKYSKLFGVCSEALDLLQIKRRVLSGNNHNPMMVERINRYLMKGLKIMTNERDSVWVALEAILLLLYAWNSCPIPCHKPPRYVPYKCTYVPYDGTFGASDQGQMLDL